MRAGRKPGLPSAWQKKFLMHDAVAVDKRKAALGLWAIFITQFVSFLFIYARNIATPGIIRELNGMPLFSWLMALSALAGSVSTLLFGKLSDIYGRRAILLLSIAIFISGLVLASLSTSMTFLVAASTFMSIGHFPIIPLCFTSIGDLFPPADRARWTGMLSLPGGIAAIVGPVLGGIVSESVVGWRGLYWGTVPLVMVAGGLALAGMPKTAGKIKPRIDTWGTLVMLVATMLLIVGTSWMGTPGKPGAGVVLLVLSTAAWIGFILVEKRTEAPILDPHVLFNRTFLTAAATSFLSCFGLLVAGSYAPIFVQSVMKFNPALSGSMQTPYTVMGAFMGIPTGLLLGRTRKYKWIYLLGFILATVAMFAMWQFAAATPVWWYILVTSVVGIGVGAFSTVNTLVAQFAVPKRLLGVAVAAMFFFQMVGLSVGPVILGLVQNSVADPESGLKLVFLVGALGLLLSLLLVITIPELPVETEGPGENEPPTAASEG
jgi:MFS family permease